MIENGPAYLFFFSEKQTSYCPKLRRRISVFIPAQRRRWPISRPLRLARAGAYCAEAGVYDA
jgi:hypothetical protein